MIKISKKLIEMGLVDPSFQKDWVLPELKPLLELAMQEAKAREELPKEEKPPQLPWCFQYA